MPYNKTAETCIKLNDSVRTLFKMMHFPEIPEEATYIAFFEDGECVFMKGEIRKSVPTAGFALPEMLFVNVMYETNVLVEDIED